MAELTRRGFLGGIAAALAALPLRRLRPPLTTNTARAAARAAARPAATLTSVAEIYKRHYPPEFIGEVAARPHLCFRRNVEGAVVNSDPNNPTVDCTGMQLAFVAWQLAKSSFHLDQADLTPTDEFKAWWDAALESLDGLSLRDICWRAFAAAHPPMEPNHGALHHFDAWWQTIVQSQPQLESR